PDTYSIFPIEGQVWEGKPRERVYGASANKVSDDSFGGTKIWKAFNNLELSVINRWHIKFESSSTNAKKSIDYMPHLKTLIEVFPHFSLPEISMLIQNFQTPKQRWKIHPTNRSKGPLAQSQLAVSKLWNTHEGIQPDPIVGDLDSDVTMLTTLILVDASLLCPDLIKDLAFKIHKKLKQFMPIEPKNI
uniref:Uncharacterized protein n=1 Tax=Romanomermis culicivorax TaxID=13658 RepID=A0A915ICP9_ROMCU